MAQVEGSFLITIFLSGGSKTLIRTCKSENVQDLTRKACNICSTPGVKKTYDKCVARKADGTLVTTPNVGDNTVLVFLPKENFETCIVNDLLAVVSRDDVERLKDLLKVSCYAAAINGLPSVKEIPIHCAVKLGLGEIISELVKCSYLDINIQTADDKRTPLHKAVGFSNRQVTATLVYCGACLGIKNKQGQTAKQEAKHPEIFKIFELVEGDPSFQSLVKEYPHLASLERFRSPFSPLIQFAQDHSHISWIESEQNLTGFKPMARAYLLNFNIMGDTKILLVHENSPFCEAALSFILSRECTKLGVDLADCDVMGADKKPIATSSLLSSVTDRHVYVRCEKVTSSSITRNTSIRTNSKSRVKRALVQDAGKKKGGRRGEIIAAFGSQTIEEHLRDPLGWDCFHAYLQSVYSGELTLFWQAVEQLQDIQDESLITQKCEAIYDQFLLHDSPHQVVLPPDVSLQLVELRKSLSKDMFSRAQRAAITGIVCTAQWQSYPTSSHFARWVDGKLLMDVDLGGIKKSHAAIKADVRNSHDSKRRLFKSTSELSTDSGMSGGSELSTARGASEEFLVHESHFGHMDTLFSDFFGAVAAIMEKNETDVSTLQILREKVEMRLKHIMKAFFPFFKGFSQYLLEAQERVENYRQNKKVRELLINSNRFAHICVEKTIATELKLFREQLDWLSMCGTNIEKERNKCDQCILLLGLFFNILKTMDRLIVFITFYLTLDQIPGTESSPSTARKQQRKSRKSDKRMRNVVASGDEQKDRDAQEESSSPQEKRERSSNGRGEGSRRRRGDEQGDSDACDSPKKRSSKSRCRTRRLSVNSRRTDDGLSTLEPATLSCYDTNSDDTHSEASGDMSKTSRVPLPERSSRSHVNKKSKLEDNEGEGLSDSSHEESQVETETTTESQPPPSESKKLSENSNLLRAASLTASAEESEVSSADKSRGKASLFPVSIVTPGGASTSLSSGLKLSSSSSESLSAHAKENRSASDSSLKVKIISTGPRSEFSSSSPNLPTSSPSVTPSTPLTASTPASLSSTPSAPSTPTTPSFDVSAYFAKSSSTRDRNMQGEAVGVTIDELISHATGDIASDLLGAAQLVFDEARDDKIWAGIKKFYFSTDSLHKARCLNLLNKWVRGKVRFGATTLSDAVADEILEFATNSLGADGFSAFSEGLSTNVQANKKRDWGKYKAPLMCVTSIPSAASPFILQFSPELIAEQLTRIDFHLFQNVNTWELQMLGKADVALHLFTSHATQLIRRADKVAFWGTTMLLDTPKPARLKMFQHLLKISYCLINNHQNYSSGLSLANGLSSKIVERLQLKDQLSRKGKDQFESLLRLFQPQRNFSNLRDAIAKSGDVALPLTSIYMKDLAITEEANETFVGKRHYNLQKFRYLYNIITEFLSKWKISHMIAEKSEPLYTFLSVLPHHTENCLYAISKNMEMRERN
eukprot:TRINITY_DN5167_c0_g2_i1.p1 TRINITY_DN5167_c0_g2~~TRINITY_DN5167_c0_g2_i1.p1  ORF type:complete len:1444 (+),score=295.64 TRINITY_DN5167_c0_g2_i1:3-4334(+)